LHSTDEESLAFSNLLKLSRFPQVNILNLPYQGTVSTLFLDLYHALIEVENKVTTTENIQISAHLPEENSALGS